MKMKRTFLFIVAFYLILSSSAFAISEILYCKVSSLNVREGPGTNYKIIGKIKKFDVVEVEEESEGWVYFTKKIFPSGGWVYKKYLVADRKAIPQQEKAKKGKTKDTNTAQFSPVRDRPKSSGSLPSVNKQEQTETKELSFCTRVIDGDTIEIIWNGKKEKVRLIGIDTPETVHPQKPVEYFGKEASAFTKRMVENKVINLEFDQNQRDKYGRLLAYVYLEDGTFLNAEILKQGYGYAYTKFPFKYMEQFREYQREARLGDRGLWE
jgi:micrococcal nuclease